ncbi:hypothetical protein B0H12DRAFT_1075646 [Mycena haematopus]|nr:hypothetical protein B0H12DRAFT_1075646 [Mycena haematopus]
MSALSLPQSPAEIKKLEKQFAKEEKREATEVKDARKEVQSTEKQQAKALKAATKADHTIEKIIMSESVAQKALDKAAHTLNKAEHKHDALLKYQEENKLTADLEAKKAHAEEVLQAQHVHAEEHKTKIRELLEQAAPESQASDEST